MTHFSFIVLLKYWVECVKWEEPNEALKLAPLGAMWQCQSFVLNLTEEKQQEHLVHFCPSTFPHDGIPKSVEDSAYGLCEAHTII